jgi:hypothetical protein
MKLSGSNVGTVVRSGCAPATRSSRHAASLTCVDRSMGGPYHVWKKKDGARMAGHDRSILSPLLAASAALLLIALSGCLTEDRAGLE